jgi:hypothetical protein
VAYESYPNLAHNARAVSLAEYERMVAPVGRTGLTGGYTTTLPVYADSTGRQVKIRAGVGALVRGFRFTNLTETIVTIAENTSGSPRIDLLVLRMNRSAVSPNAFAINPFVIVGTPAATPSAPSPVTQDSPDGTGVWDFPLGDVKVANGAVTIAAADVTNRAWWTAETGYTCHSAARPPHGAGRQIYEGDTGRGYISTGSRWVPILDDAGVVTPTMATGWAPASLYLSRINGVTYLNGSVKRTGASLTPASATASVMTIPAGYQPRNNFTHSARVVHSGADAAMRILTTGAINVDLFGAGCATNQFIDLASACWPVAIS